MNNNKGYKQMNNLYFTDKTKRPVLIKDFKKFVIDTNLTALELGLKQIPINISKKEVIKKLLTCVCFLKDFKVFDTMENALNYRDN